MDQTTFSEIKTAIAQWADRIKACPHVVTNIIFNTDEALRIIFEGKEHVAELLVESGSFAPYRYVKMEILSLASDDPTPIYRWYDSPSDHIETIIANLQIGLQFLSE